MIDLDNEIQPSGDLTGGEVVPMKPKEGVAARGAGVVADSVAGEKSGHVRVRDLRFELLYVER